MVATYVHDGKVIDYRPTDDVAAGDVVTVGALIGVAHLDIKAGELGGISLSGVYDVAKAAGKAFALGAVAYWDAATGTAVDATGKPRLGVVVVEAVASDTTVRVRLG